MKKLKSILISIASVLIIAFICLRVAGELRSCSGPGKEYVYNETVTLSYLLHNSLFEDTYERFSEGDRYFLTDYEYAQAASGQEFSIKNRLKGDIEFLRTDFKQAQADLARLIPSAEATAFHEQVQLYYHTVLTDYFFALRDYSLLDRNDSVRQLALRGRVDSVYNRICDIQTEMLQRQIEYGKRVGLENRDKKTTTLN